MTSSLKTMSPKAPTPEAMSSSRPRLAPSRPLCARWATTWGMKPAKGPR
jgi:hypothetical protein